MDATDLTRLLYEAYQGRDWARAEACLHPAAEVEVRAAAWVFRMAAFRAG